MSDLISRGQRIFRFEVPVDDQWHPIKFTGDPLHIAARTTNPVEFWAFEPGTEAHVRLLRVFGTGHQMSERARYWGTALAPSGLVWHLMEMQ